MTYELTTDEWSEILLNKQITKPIDLVILQVVYSFEEYKASSSQIGRILGYKGKAHSPVNLEIGNYGRRIARHYRIEVFQRDNGSNSYWTLFFDGWNEGKYFVWQLLPELIDALEETGLTGDTPLPDEIPITKEEDLFEGAKRTIVVNAFERNSKSRDKCIEHYGAICIICSFNFEKLYGELGKGFIHVHHLTPLSEIGKEYKVNPIEDLRPVCPNCHAMLHKKEPALTIDELKSLLTS